jgi:hypothetical protein
VATLEESLAAGKLRWRPRGDGRWELDAGGEKVATLRGDTAEIDGRTFRITTHRGYAQLEDVAREAPVAKLRTLPSGPGVIDVANQRLRIAREGILPLVFQVTVEAGGPQILRMLRMGSTLRLRPGAQPDAGRASDLPYVLVLVAVHLLQGVQAAAA